MPRAVVLFFALTFAITFGLQLPAVLAHHGLVAGPPERFMALVGLGALGPTFAAMIMARARGGLRALFAPLGRWRVGLIYWVIALFGSGALLTVGLLVASLFVRDVGPWWYPPLEAPRIIAMLVFPLGEEIGWRGFALPLLQRRMGGIAASLVVGLGWAGWHAMMFVLAGLPWWSVLAFVPFFVAGSLCFTWLWNRTGGSSFIAVLAHVGTHLDNSHRALPGNAIPAVVHGAGFVLLASALVAFDRRTFREQSTHGDAEPRPVHEP